jgi:hypothetical protein
VPSYPAMHVMSAFFTGAGEGSGLLRTYSIAAA